MDAERLSEGELDQHLRTGDTVDRAALDDERVVAALLAVRAAVEIEAPPGPRSSRFGTLPRERRRWVSVGATAAAVAVASLVGVETLTGGSGGGGLPLGVPPAAAVVLKQVAAAASAQAAPAAGQWEYSETRSEQIQPATAAGSTIELAGTQTIQTWQAPDGATRVRVVRDGVSPATNRGRAIYLAHKSAFWKLGLSLRERGGEVQMDGLTSAAHERSSPCDRQVWNTAPPSDPRTLLAEISDLTRKCGARGLPSKSAQNEMLVFQALANILATSTSSRLRATAYRALSHVWPHTEVLGTRTDQLGRSGVAVSFSGNPYVRFVVIVSASTGDLLEETQTFTKEGTGRSLPAGLWQNRLVVLRRAIVDSPTSLPGGGTQPYPHRARS